MSKPENNNELETQIHNIIMENVYDIGSYDVEGIDPETATTAAKLIVALIAQAHAEGVREGRRVELKWARQASKSLWNNNDFQAKITDRLNKENKYE